MTKDVQTGWLHNKEDGLFAPKTLINLVQDKDGNNLEYILNNLEAKNIIYDDKTTLFNTTNVQNAIEIVDHSLIAPAFVPGQIYNIGDYVTYNNKLYKSKVNTQASVYKLPIVDASGSGNGRYYYSLGASSGTYTKYTSDDAYGGWFKNAIFICSKISEGVTLRRDWDGMKYYAYQDTFVYNGEIWYAILFNVGLPNVETNYPFKRITELENFDIDVSKNIPTQELVTTFLDLATGNSFDTTAWEEVTVISEIKDEAKEILYDDTESQLGVNNVQSAIEYLVENGGSSITIDTELSGSSKNPVQNKVIYNELQNLKLNAIKDTKVVYVNHQYKLTNFTEAGTEVTYSYTGTAGNLVIAAFMYREETLNKISGFDSWTYLGTSYEKQEIVSGKHDYPQNIDIFYKFVDGTEDIFKYSINLANSRTMSLFAEFKNADIPFWRDDLRKELGSQGSTITLDKKTDNCVLFGTNAMYWGNDTYSWDISSSTVRQIPAAAENIQSRTVFIMDNNENALPFTIVNPVVTGGCGESVYGIEIPAKEIYIELLEEITDAEIEAAIEEDKI